jgi:hypothetical protein
MMGVEQSLAQQRAEGNEVVPQVCLSILSGASGEEMSRSAARTARKLH